MSRQFETPAGGIPGIPASRGVAGIDRTSATVPSPTTEGVNLGAGAVTAATTAVITAVTSTTAPIASTLKPLIQRAIAKITNPSGPVTAPPIPPATPATLPPFRGNGTDRGTRDFCPREPAPAVVGDGYYRGPDLEWTAADLVMLVAGPVAGTIILAIFGLAWNFVAELALYKGYGNYRHFPTNYRHLRPDAKRCPVTQLFCFRSNPMTNKVLPLLTSVRTYLWMCGKPGEATFRRLPTVADDDDENLYEVVIEPRYGNYRHFPTNYRQLRTDAKRCAVTQLSRFPEACAVCASIFLHSYLVDHYPQMRLS